jgi:hypothetical protein
VNEPRVVVLALPGATRHIEQRERAGDIRADERIRGLDAAIDV